MDQEKPIVWLLGVCRRPFLSFPGAWRAGRPWVRPMPGNAGPLARLALLLLSQVLSKR